MIIWILGLLDFYILVIGAYLKFLDVGILIEWNLVCFSSLNMEVLILIDWMSILFAGFVGLISLIILVYRVSYIEGDKFKDRFIGLVLLFIFSMVLMILSPNVISIILGWDGLGVISYFLVIYYQNYNSYNSGMVTVLINRIGDMGLLISIGIIILYGSWNIWIVSGMTEFDYLIIVIIIFASMTKRAQVPFSAWLPIAMAAPTPVSALVHSSTLVTAGVYLLIRFSDYLIIRGLNVVVIYVSLVTSIISGVIAMLEWDLKKIIALSTLNQLGLIMMILRMGYRILTFFHLLVHAIFKSILFMGAGIVIHFMSIIQDIRILGGVNKFMPIVIIRFYISLMSLCGFPFISGFYSKDLIMEFIYLININFIYYYLIIVCLIFTVAYSLRLFVYLFFINYKFSRFIYYKDSRPMNLSMIILIILRIFGGSMMVWMFFFDLKLPYLRIYYKSLTIMIMLAGLLYVVVYFIIRGLLILNLKFYLSSIIGLIYVHKLINIIVNRLGLELYQIDKTWMERGAKDLKNIIIFNIYSYKYKIFMFVYVHFLVIYGLFVWFYLNSLY